MSMQLCVNACVLVGESVCVWVCEGESVCVIMGMSEIMCMSKCTCG